MEKLGYNNLKRYFGYNIKRYFGYITKPQMTVNPV